MPLQGLTDQRSAHSEASRPEPAHDDLPAASSSGLVPVVHEAANVRSRHARGLLPRCLRFAAARFGPTSYGPLLVVFVGGVFVASGPKGTPLDDLLRVGTAGAVVLLSLFALRANDDAKDADVDYLGRPERPVPAGIVSAPELRSVATGCLAAALALGVALPPPAFIADALSVTFLWLSGREFFAAARVHRDIVTYALVHSPALPLLACVVWLANPNASVGPPLIAMMGTTAGVSLGLEVVRKTVPPGQERDHVETYSAALGIKAALAVAVAATLVAALSVLWYALAVGAPPWASAVPMVVLCVAASVAVLATLVGVQAARVALASAAVSLILWPAVIRTLA